VYVLHVLLVPLIWVAARTHVQVGMLTAMSLAEARARQPWRAAHTCAHVPRFFGGRLGCMLGACAAATRSCPVHAREHVRLVTKSPTGHRSNPQPGIEALLNAMEDHPTIAEVQEKACGALWNLADNDDNQVKGKFGSKLR